MPQSQETKDELEKWLDDADRRLWMRHEERRSTRTTRNIAILGGVLTLSAVFGGPAIFDRVTDVAVEKAATRVTQNIEHLKERATTALANAEAASIVVKEISKQAEKRSKAALINAEEALTKAEEGLEEVKVTQADIRQRSDTIRGEVDVALNSFQEQIDKLVSGAPENIRLALQTSKREAEDARNVFSKNRVASKSKLAVETDVPKPLAGGGLPITLRKRYDSKLSDRRIFEGVREYGFSLPGQNLYGNFQHNYELIDKDGSGNQVIVVDHETGLMWQQSGSPDTRTYADALKFVDELNDKCFADHKGWRLPTIEELISLVEPTQKNGILYIDEIFNDRQRWIRSGDKKSYGNTWGIVFYEGSLYFPTLNFPYYVRAVRSASLPSCSTAAIGG